MKKYKKKANVSKTALATARILSTVLLLCFLGYLGFVIIFQGFETLVAWFEGKWFTFAILIALFAITAGLWIFSLYKRMKGFEDHAE